MAYHKCTICFGAHSTCDTQVPRLAIHALLRMRLKQLAQGVFLASNLQHIIRATIDCHVSVDEPWVPQTLALNTTRLRDCQNAFQRILVIGTGLLVARQGLMSQDIASLKLEEIMEKGKQKLEILLNETASSLTQIGTVLAEIANRAAEVETSDPPAEPMSAELMTRVLRKSLSPEDPVFARVSAAVEASLRALLVLGKSSEGMAVAQAALKRIGGVYLMDKVIATADALEVLAEVTCRVHEPRYSCIVGAFRTSE
ncbi:hypothetical protein KC19_3G210200 [Ceratodon purpureus]|uniref:Uncharacterized protein n=2 Tax=Ceratodon purpureus TaxID=3225 RepID=A0A8T0IN75_CERPU|nr:hypothetical protein KC19_3G209400 [Ceratodon purpureus]KAG0584447.1 hypothetical protein KC19_3G210200 [Ceratodon purpureus]